MRVFGVRVSVSFWFFVVVALFVMSDRQLLLWYFLLPVAIHEGGHLLAMVFCRVRLEGLHFSPVGIRVRTRNPGRLSYGKEFWVMAGGILANLLAALLLWRLSFQSMRNMLLVSANLAVAFFNLLPVGNLDGGQMLRLLCDGVLPPGTARAVSLAVSFVVLTPLFALGIFLLLQQEERNFTLLLLCTYLAVTLIAGD